VLVQVSSASEHARVPDPRHQLGRLGERLALEHLERLGYELVAANHRTRFGELDLIVRDATTLVFVEVKTRRGHRADRHWERLDSRKRSQVRRIAAAWLAETAERPYVDELRFDAIGITIDPHGAIVALEHLEAAF
jgi:putative endonuclease